MPPEFKPRGRSFFSAVAAGAADGTRFAVRLLLRWFGRGRGAAAPPALLAPPRIIVPPVNVCADCGGAVLVDDRCPKCGRDWAWLLRRPPPA